MKWKILKKTTHKTYFQKKQFGKVIQKYVLNSLFWKRISETILWKSFQRTQLSPLQNFNLGILWNNVLERKKINLREQKSFVSMAMQQVQKQNGMRPKRGQKGKQEWGTGGRKWTPGKEGEKIVRFN